MGHNIMFTFRNKKNISELSWLPNFILSSARNVFRTHETKFLLYLAMLEKFFSPIGQEYPFLQVSEIFLSQPAVSAYYTTTTLVAFPVNCMQNVKLTPSDVQEMSLDFW